VRAGACARAGAVSEELRALQPASFAALIQGNGFTLWHYRTGDTRAVVVASNYFAPVAASLRPGDLMILQAADALALLPVRSGPVIGTGVTLDGAVGALSLVRSAAQRFSFAQTAQAVVRTLVLGPVAASMVAGSAFAVSATVTGPVSQVVFTVVDSDGVVVPTSKTVSVANGRAATSFRAPAIGTGYRIHAEDAQDPNVAAVSRSFSVGPDLKLLLIEDDTTLLTEAGGRLVQ
jgi:hypothetical protein